MVVAALRDAAGGMSLPVAVAMLTLGVVGGFVGGYQWCAAARTRRRTRRHDREVAARRAAVEARRREHMTL